MRVKKRVFGGLAGAAAVAMLATGTAPAAAAGVVTASGPLSDLSAGAEATDGGRGRLVAYSLGDGSTHVLFILTGLDRDAVGETYGAHVHVGPCVAGNGPAALGHYNTGEGSGASPSNEVWLDFTVQPGGFAMARTTVPFEIAPGTAQSVVVHAEETNPSTGGAGGRIACLPVRF